MHIDTRRRIDEARDILVGKVPDPKSQVEQITIALTYKFMDDMDKETIELGGKATFFTGEFEKYSWSNIFDPKLGGFDLINLYSEALTTLNQNSNMPQLFRDLFKNAFLPYRDPETLKSFLKVINGFKYDHSENLGDAYEYLLSVMSSQGDAGQFRTPRHIIDFIVKIIDPKKNETILDPACGTGGFLISSYRHILQQNTINASGDKLTPDDRQRLINNIVGYDISPDMVRLSLMNMYLHLFQNPKIYEYDTLTSEERWQENYDVILANPPFMTPKGGIRPHKRFSIQAKRSEVLFVDYIMEHLNSNGRAGVIVPEGIVFQSQNAYKELRKQLVDGNYLYAVVSLPAGIFNPYSGVKTSILLMDRVFAKQKDEILFVKINNDGYDLGAQRREIKGSDIPEVIKIIKDYLEDNDVSDNVLVTMASKKDIAEQDYILVGERYNEAVVVSSDYPTVELGEICEVISGQSPDSKYYNTEGLGIPFYQGKSEFTEKYLGNPTKWTTSVTKEAVPNDILMSVRAPVGPVNVTNQKICIGRGLAAIRCKENVLVDYLFACLKAKEHDISGNGGAVFDSISRGDISLIKIPLPPLHIQEEIVKEIEGYQKIIDGARQVVENYKSTIKIDPSWEVRLLEEVATIRTGKIDVNRAVENGEYPFFTCAKEPYYINEYAFDCEALLLAGNNATANYDVKHYKGKFNAYQRTYVITINHKDVRYEYLKVIMDSNLENLKRKSIGSQTKYLTLGVIKALEIPIPPFPIQQKIVEQINEEVKIVEQNKRLIEMFEQKTKDKISEVWGE